MNRYVATVAYSAGPLCGSDAFVVHAIDEAAAKEVAQTAFWNSNRQHGNALAIRRVTVTQPRHEGDAR